MFKQKIPKKNHREMRQKLRVTTKNNEEERPKKMADRTLWDEQHSVKETLCATESRD